MQEFHFFEFFFGSGITIITTPLPDHIKTILDKEFNQDGIPHIGRNLWYN